MKKRKRGRPRLPTILHGGSVHVYLRHDELAYVRQLGSGEGTVGIRRLVREALEKKIACTTGGAGDQ